MPAHKVKSIVERRYVFYLPIERDSYYRHVVSAGVWRHHSRLKDNDNLGCYIPAKDMVNCMLGNLFGYDSKHLIHIEHHNNVPQWVFSVNADTCPYTQQSMEVAFQVLTDMLNNDSDFRADPYDTLTKFYVPDQVVEALQLSKE